MMAANYPQNNNQDNSWMGCAKLLVVFFILAALGSCSPRNLPPVQETITEQTSVDYKDSTAWRDTTIYIPIPLENWQVVASVKDTARAETSVASAVSYLDSLGFLHLDLQNKPVKLKGVVSIPHRTIMVNASSSKEHIKPLVVPVEKPLSWWQTFRIKAFWWLLGAVAGLLLWCTRKLWLKLLV